MPRAKSETDRASEDLLRREAKRARARLALPLALGVAQVAAGIAQALLFAILLATLLGFGQAGWAELGAAAALAALQAGLGVAQERALVATGEEAKARLRAAAFERLLAEGPADGRPVGERAALVVDRIEAIIRSMTPLERRRPELIKGSRRLRIAKGSGTSVQQVNQLVKQFGEMRKLMKGMQSGKMPDLGQLMRNR